MSNFLEPQLEVINSLKPVKPSRYYRLENDGTHKDMYGHREITLTASGAEIMQILSALENKLDMKWRFAYYDTFPTLKQRGKYTLRIDNEYFYSVRRNYHYEVDKNFV